MDTNCCEHVHIYTYIHDKPVQQHKFSSQSNMLWKVEYTFTCTCIFQGTATLLQKALQKDHNKWQVLY